MWSDKLVSGEDCLLVPPGDVRALREAINYFWKNPEHANSIGARARETVIRNYPFKTLQDTLLRRIFNSEYEGECNR